MEFIKYLDIPPPSTYLKLEEVKKLENKFVYKDEEHFYSIHRCEPKLKAELLKIYPNEQSPSIVILLFFLPGNCSI